jgi:hypothetical protein
MALESSIDKSLTSIIWSFLNNFRYILVSKWVDLLGKEAKPSVQTCTLQNVQSLLNSDVNWT